MTRRLLLTALVILCTTALAQEPAPPPVGESAPVPPPGATALLIAHKDAGFQLPLDKRTYPAIFRGVIQTVPAGHRVLIYLPPAGSPALIEVLDKAVGWSESSYMRQSGMIESTLGRPYFKHLNSSGEVLTAVSGDPGGVGVVSADTLLSPSVVILWPQGGP